MLMDDMVKRFQRFASAIRYENDTEKISTHRVLQLRAYSRRHAFYDQIYLKIKSDIVSEEGSTIVKSCQLKRTS